VQEAKKVALQDNSETLNVCLLLPDPAQRKIPGGSFVNGACLHVAKTHNFICPAGFAEK